MRFRNRKQSSAIFFSSALRFVSSQIAEFWDTLPTRRSRQNRKRKRSIIRNNFSMNLDDRPLGDKQTKATRAMKNRVRSNNAEMDISSFSFTHWNWSESQNEIGDKMICKFNCAVSDGDDRNGRSDDLIIASFILVNRPSNVRFCQNNLRPFWSFQS